METIALTLALIERLDDHGQVLQLHRVHHWPQKIGRAVDNDLLIDDPHVAAHHAMLAPRRKTEDTTAQVDATLPAAPVRSPEEEHTLELAVGDTLNGVSLCGGSTGSTTTAPTTTTKATTKTTKITTTVTTTTTKTRCVSQSVL